MDFGVIEKIAREAGDEILNIYNDSALTKVVDYKSDDSPLTLADKASHNVIMEGLKTHFSKLPIISEEGKEVPYGIRKSYAEYWLVDPLDGTKEFINRNGEFTVNIALIRQGKPVFGVVYAPVLDEMFVGREEGCYKISKGVTDKLKVNGKQANRIAVRSKSHASPEEEIVLKEYDVHDSISVGSSLKFCMVAEGKADLYYRHGPTMEWDIAAGQAVVEAAGGRVEIGTGGHQFQYNKQNLLNGSFIVFGF